MAVNISVRPVEPGDIEYVAERMRQADRDEITATGVPDPLTAIDGSVRASTMCWTACADGVPVCIFGAVPISMLCGIGSPWLLSTELSSKMAGAFIRHLTPYIHGMLREFPHLFNFVDVRNRKSVTWLKRSGFVLREAIPYGPFGLLFHPFEMRA